VTGAKDELGGRVVVLTGARGRLGRIVAERLAAAGARVAALDVVPPDGLPAGVTAFGADLADEGEVAEAFQRVATEVGAPYALVHTIGMWDGSPLTATTLDAWERMIRVNLTSTFLCFREAARAMRRAHAGGRLVAIASRQGADGAPAEQGAYAASKAGVIRLVEASAAEYAAEGITAAAVAPSTMLFGDEGDGARGVPAERVADLCVYLCGAGGAVHNGAVLRAYGDA
jgi:NAD(P)-dependent dehydrogenase (short-subunit alcohol dehydrogenase family)